MAAPRSGVVSDRMLKAARTAYDAMLLGYGMDGYLADYNLEEIIEAAILAEPRLSAVMLDRAGPEYLSTHATPE